jgi:UDP-2,3-diacylglucosamine pyrophosphatase LpxH
LLSAEFQQTEKSLIERLQSQMNRLRGCPIRRIYIPGNHDRLMLLDDELKNMLLGALGARLPNPDYGVHEHVFESADYGVLARHGHEWDVWNFEAFREKHEVQAIEAAAFHLVPIGDPITTELVARLPYETHRALLYARVHAMMAAGVYQHLQQIEDVRPLSAAIQWVLAQGDHFEREYQSQQKRTIVEELQRTVKQVMTNFMHVPFVQHWVRQHDRWGLDLDEADQLQDIDRAVRLLKLDAVGKLIKVTELPQAWRSAHGDDLEQGACQEPVLTDAQANSGIRYCVYGHTHTFCHRPLSCDAEGGERVYFNSGTWRARVARTRDAKAFVRYKEMSWLAFYSGAEDRVDPSSVKGTSYETWNGLMMKRRR